VGRLLAGANRREQARWPNKILPRLQTLTAMRPPTPKRDSTPSAPAGAWLPPLLLFVSGAVALVYEVVWQRQFALVLGSGATATAAVLAAYFAGLGAGAWTVGRLAPRWTRPLRAYVVLEALVGVGALLVTPLLGGLEAFYPQLFGSLSGQPALFTSVRVAAAFVVLLIPTFCMGGTLPLLGGFVDRERRRLGLTADWLYVVNTAGAALGALSVPFLLLPRLGLTHAVWLCATLNLLLAAAAWWLDRRQGTPTPQAAPPPPPLRRAAPDTTGRVLPLALISGFVTFALQVLWNRAFAQVHENSMHSFALIVAVVIFALAVGAQAARLGLRLGLSPQQLISRAWIAGGLVIVAGPWIFLRLTGGLGYLGEGGGQIPRLAGQALLALFAPMALVGVALPALMEQAGRAPGEAAGRVLGRLLAVNLAGSVTGALAAGFLLPGWLGLWAGLIWLGAVVLVAGLWVRQQRYGLAHASAALLLLLPVSRIDLPRVKLDAGREQLLALAEGPHGITAVTEQAGSRRLKLNNHYALGGTAATGDERMQAHLPLLLHPAPRAVAFLGLGTGISAGGATFHPVERITAMELVPGVIAAARIHFRDANAGVLDDPRTTVVADDARNFLRGSGAKFDVIIGDLVVPWRQGEGALFTREQFAAARAALAPGGLFCQWLPLFQLTEEQLQIVLRTFLAEFPRAQVWRGDFSPTAPAIALVATSDGTGPDPELVRRRLAEMRPDPANPHLLLPDAAWMHFAGMLESADLSAAETRLNTEDRPWVELLGPDTAGTAPWFTGRLFQDWLDALGIRSLARPNLLSEPERNGVAAGRALGAMTLAMQEQNRAGVLAAQDRVRSLLPPETYRGLFP
jgi:spermidine synthase